METPAKPDLLIVDDDPLITETLNFVLGQDFNVRVGGLQNPGQEPAAAAGHPTGAGPGGFGPAPPPHRPDEGFQLITDLLAHSPAIKILVLSGQNDEANARYARTLGAIEFIAKPCEPE